MNVGILQYIYTILAITGTITFVALGLNYVDKGKLFTSFIYLILTLISVLVSINLLFE